MKKVLFMLVPLILGLSACSNQLGSNEEREEIIEPIYLQDISEEDSDDSLLDIPGIELLAKSVLTENGLIEDYIGIKDFPDVAMIVNQKELLKDVESNGEVFLWPEIDFDKYSLVIGQFFTSETGYSISRQYIKKGLSKRVLYIEIVKDSLFFCATANNYFAVLYPKVPDGELEVKRLIKAVAEE